MTLLAKLRIIFFITLASVAFDQVSKWWAANYLTHSGMNSYLADILRIGYVENSGAFLGLGSELPEHLRFSIFVVAVGLLLLTLLVYMLKSTQQTTYSLISLSFIFSGGISNFYDRAMNNGAVIDFLNIGFGSIRTGIFNVADMAIMLGVIMLFFTSTSKDSPVLEN